MRLKRVLRYLRAHPQCRSCFKWQSPPKGVTVFSDSGWAGDRATRKSTSGEVVMHGIALSSGEAELNDHAFGLSEGLGAATLCEESKMPCGVERLLDSFAARGIAFRGTSR